MDHTCMHHSIFSYWHRFKLHLFSCLGPPWDWSILILLMDQWLHHQAFDQVHPWLFICIVDLGDMASVILVSHLVLAGSSFLLDHPISPSFLRTYLERDLEIHVAGLWFRHGLLIPIVPNTCEFWVLLCPNVNLSNLQRLTHGISWYIWCCNVPTSFCLRDIDIM